MNMNFLCHLAFVSFAGLAAGYAVGKSIDLELMDIEPHKNDGEREEAVMDTITSINQENDLTYLYEGDINLLDDIYDDDGSRIIKKRDLTTLMRVKRDAKRRREYLWRDRIVPYEISYDLSSYSVLIEESLKEIESKTCVRFKKKTTDVNWIHFVSKKGCWSSIGKLYWRTGPQDVSLGSGCLVKGTIIHEVLHALGFWHEQGRPDRDKYVEIFWENIQKGQEFNFEKSSYQDSDTLLVKYDYYSVMHYGARAFSKNDKKTMQAIGNPTLTLGQKKGLSELDIIQLDVLYDCKNAGKSLWSQWSQFSTCDKNCRKFRQRFCTDLDSSKCEGANKWGIETQKLKCAEDTTECYVPTDGHWGRWGAWNSCNKICGSGMQTRYRSCNDPKPKYNGRLCAGNAEATQTCKRTSCTKGPDDCEFDSEELCYWKNDIRNDKLFDWFRNSENTPSGKTGPSKDHTTGKGYYLYIESSSPARPGYKARLISKEFTATSSRCITFFYHMYGETMGKLSVYLHEVNSINKVTLWEKSGNQGDRWIKGEQWFAADKPYKIIFEGVKGSSFTGDIGLDDIKFKEGLCNQTPMPNVTTQKPTTLVYSTKPQPRVEKIGCYRDDGERGGKRPFPKYFDYRPQIKWTDIHEIVDKCSRKVRALGFKYFAIEFYGECWFGPTQEINYARDGVVQNCWNGVGRSRAMMVYRWTD